MLAYKSKQPKDPPSKRFTFVQLILFLSISLNFVALYRSLSIGNENDVDSSFSREDPSFLPPKLNPKEKKEEIRKLETTHNETQPTKSMSLSHNYSSTHFLSHIPKTGGEYAAKELARLLLATIPLPGNKSVISIKEAQKRYDISLKSRPGYNETDEEWLFFHKKSRNHDHENPDSDAYAPPFICNHGTIPFHNWAPFFPGFKGKIKFRCIMAVSEHAHRGDVPNGYTIVREPLSHVVSQYFHCTDSLHHKKKEIMPPMKEWLDAYKELADSLPWKERLPYELGRWSRVEKARKLGKKFNCYNPIDTESLFVGFPGKDDNGERILLPKDYVYPYPFDGSLPRNQETRRLDQQLFDDLKRRYRIIGDTSQMIKTVCSIFIDMTNGEYIPKPCDCTYWNEEKKKEHSTTPTFHVPNLYQTDITQGMNNRFWMMHPYVELGYHSEKHGHGVTVRGSEFAEEGLTVSQRTQITEHLRPLDLVLYNISRAVFDAQTAELEAAYGIKICDSSFNREGEIILEEEESSKRIERLKLLWKKRKVAKDS